MTNFNKLKERLEEKEKRLQELQKFASDVKEIARSTGRSLSIPLDKIEKLIVKYNIRYNDEKN